jgi:hypothetical protein
VLACCVVAFLEVADAVGRRTATLTHGGGIHAAKETLRHSTITLTSDPCTNLLPELDREIAEKAAALVPRSRQQGQQNGDPLLCVVLVGHVGQAPVRPRFPGAALTGSRDCKPA